jgi:hypothetical protein
LLVATGASTPANLAVGSDGSTLVANSASATGMAWTAGNPIPNPVHNSCFDIWQRGTSSSNNGTSASATNADRWINYLGSGAITVSRQSTNDTTNLPNIQYCARVQRNSGNTATGAFYSVQNFESVNSIPFAGKTVTFSFYARAGANFSSSGNAFNATLISGTGTDENAFAGYTGSNNVVNNNVTLTTTWQRFSASGTVPATAKQLGIYFLYSATGTAGANDYYEVTGVQIDVGSVALPVRRNGSTLQGELAACQRYYYRQTASYNYSTMANWSAAYTTSIVDSFFIPFPVTMRVAQPSSGALTYSNIQISDGITNYSGGTWTFSSSGSSAYGAALKYQHSSAALTQFRSYIATAANNSSGYIEFSAEL